MSASAARITQRPAFQDTGKGYRRGPGAPCSTKVASAVTAQTTVWHVRPRRAIVEPHKSQGRRAPMTSLRRTLGLWQVSVSGIGDHPGCRGLRPRRPGGRAGWQRALAGLPPRRPRRGAHRLLVRAARRDAAEGLARVPVHGARVRTADRLRRGLADADRRLLAVAAVALGFGGYLAHLVGTAIVANAPGSSPCTVVDPPGRHRRSRSHLAIVLTVVEAAGLALRHRRSGVPAWGRANYLETPHGVTGLSRRGRADLLRLPRVRRDRKLRRGDARPDAKPSARAVHLHGRRPPRSTCSWRSRPPRPSAGRLSVRRPRPSRWWPGGSCGPRGGRGAQPNRAWPRRRTPSCCSWSAAARSVYGMAAAGVLPRWLGVVDRRGVPTRAMLVVTAITGALVLLGDLTAGGRPDRRGGSDELPPGEPEPPLGDPPGRGGPRSCRPRARFVLPVLALLMCGWLLVHTGWPSLATATALALVGLLVGRERPEPGRGCPGAGTRAGRTQGLLTGRATAPPAEPRRPRSRHRTRPESRELRVERGRGPMYDHRSGTVRPRVPS